MKKVLAMVLAICTILSCMVFAVSAEEAEKKSVLWLNCDDLTGFPESCTVNTTEKTEGAGSVEWKFNGALDGPGALMLRYSDTTKPVDATGTTAISFDLFVSNAAALNGTSFCFELTSADESDKEEMQIGSTWKDLKDGWNHLVYAYSSFAQASGPDGAACDLSRVDFLRIFNTSAVNAGEELIIRMDNITLFDNTTPAPEGVLSEKYVFQLYTEDEAKYLDFTNAGDNQNQRFSDCGLYTVYHYTVKNTTGTQSITWSARLGAQLRLLVSQNNVDFTEFFNSGEEHVSPDMYSYDITQYIDFSKGKDIYIKIADSVEADGNGGSIFKSADCTLEVLYKQLPDSELDALEAAADERSMALLGCNEAFGSFVRDTEDRISGSSSLKTNVGTGFVNSIKFATPVNGTGYDAVEFDLYVSDPALFDKFQGEGKNDGFEVTSSGTWDQAEICWRLPQMKAGIENGPVAGWNHVVLFIRDAGTSAGDAGDFDITKINFIRFFMVNEDPDTGIELKLDNVRLTKAAAEADAAQALLDKAAAERVDTLIGKIGTVDEFSEKVIVKAEEAYEKLNSTQKKLVTAYETLTKARADYDAIIAAKNPTAPTDPTDPTNPTNPTNPTEPTKPTDDNKSSSTTVIVIVVVVVVVLAAAACLYFFVFKKKGAKK